MMYKSWKGPCSDHRDLRHPIAQGIPIEGGETLELIEGGRVCEVVDLQSVPVAAGVAQCGTPSRPSDRDKYR